MFKVGILTAPWTVIFRAVGGLLIVAGIIVWYIGSMRSDMDDSITENRLQTKGMADHFFNNCIATNLFHVVTESGVDEMMIIRVAIAQLLSFVVVLLVGAKRRTT